MTQQLDVSLSLIMNSKFKTHFEYLESLIRQAVFEYEHGKQDIIIDVYREEDIEVIELALELTFAECNDVDFYIRLSRIN